MNLRKAFIAIGVVIFTPVLLLAHPHEKKEKGLKDVFAPHFFIGAAMNTPHIYGTDTSGVKVIRQHFNSIVAENVMKSGPLQPSEGRFNFDAADRFVEFGTENRMHIIGHTLIWHSQAPIWFFTDNDGNDVSAEELTERMRNHIHTVVKRYKGRVHGWDVVNEAILDDGSWRKSKFYTILGEDFVRLAFQFAHEADPDAELYYNDYSMANPGKREGVIAMIKKLQQQNIRIDGIGMQGHVSMHYPSIDAFEASLTAFSALGVKVMITELDLSALPPAYNHQSANIADTAAYQARINPYVHGLPADVAQQWEDRYLDFFRLFIQHSDKISRVTLWGVSDAHTWLNNFPVRGRIDYPLLFDRNYEPKPIVGKLMNWLSEVK